MVDPGASPRGQPRLDGSSFTPGHRPGVQPTRLCMSYLSPMQHLYLHVPFCQRRCSYCDFSIAVRKRIPVTEYVNAVLREWGSADLGPADRGGPISTLYCGGGTPSLLPPDAIATLVHALLRSADPGPAARGEGTPS